MYVGLWEKLGVLECKECVVQGCYRYGQIPQQRVMLMERKGMCTAARSVGGACTVSLTGEHDAVWGFFVFGRVGYKGTVSLKFSLRVMLSDAARTHTMQFRVTRR